MNFCTKKKKSVGNIFKDMKPEKTVQLLMFPLLVCSNLKFILWEHASVTGLLLISFISWESVSIMYLQ